MRIQKQADQSLVFKNVLVPWIERRTEIFWFHEGEAMFNFGVYIHEESSNLLKVAFRSHDDRLQAENRDWPPGQGQIGACFAGGKPGYVDDLTAESGQPFLIPMTDRDRAYYRSVVCAPIIIASENLGVFVVTSSVPNQFAGELHAEIAQNIASLPGQAIRDCLHEVPP